MSVVLIVEDELLELDFLKSIISKELRPEDQLITGETGVQAVDRARQYRPDIILIDILIPELDGLHALKEIEKFLPNVRVMILSAYSDFSYAQQAIRLHVQEYMLKPIKPAELTQSFHNLLISSSTDSNLHAPNPKSLHPVYFIEQSIQYINANFKQKLPLKTVSAQVFMNPQYFSRIFKKEVGVTYIDYINKLKIDYACKLLETTDYPAYRISSECGFSDPSYFNRVFVQQMKMTPNIFRRKRHCNSIENDK